MPNLIRHLETDDFSLRILGGCVVVVDHECKGLVTCCLHERFPCHSSWWTPININDRFFEQYKVLVV
jgi:hypothetical protein